MSYQWKFVDKSCQQLYVPVLAAGCHVTRWTNLISEVAKTNHKHQQTCSLCSPLNAKMPCSCRNWSINKSVKQRRRRRQQQPGKQWVVSLACFLLTFFVKGGLETVSSWRMPFGSLMQQLWHQETSDSGGSFSKWMCVFFFSFFLEQAKTSWFFWHFSGNKDKH